MKRFPVLFILLIAAQLAAMGFELTDKELSEMKFPQEEWMSLMISGVKVGYAHTFTDLTESNGEKLIRIRSEMKMNIKRMGFSLEVSQTKESLIGRDLVPRSFVSSTSEMNQSRKTIGVIKDGKAQVRMVLGDKTTEQTVDLPENVLFEEALGYFALSKKLRPGDEYSINLFSMELLKPIPVKVTALPRETIEYDGRKINVNVLSYYLDMMGGMENREWIGDDGTTYKMEIAGLMGLKMELVKTTMEEALGEVGEVDVIISTKLFPSGKPIHGNPRYLRARIELNDADPTEMLARFPQQRIRKVGGHYELEISREPMSDSDAPKIPIDSDDFGEYLKPTLYVQSDDPSIRSKAREIIGDERNSWRAAKLLSDWVYRNIRDKSLRVGFGSAKATLESLQGDCTEHTVLAVALARSVGIPARICAGLVYQGDAFYYHFWPEMFVGRWVQMEPTLGELEADAAHIQLAGGKLESNTALEYGEGVLRTLNRLSIEILEVK